VWALARAIGADPVESEIGGPIANILVAIKRPQAPGLAGLSMSRMLHLEERHEYLAPVCDGDMVITQSAVTRAIDTRRSLGGACLTVSAVGSSTDGHVLFRTQTVLLVR
jgi:hypothetical protein